VRSDGVAQLWPDYVSVVSEARFHDKVGGEAGDVARVRYSRQKPLAGTADPVFGNSIDFRLEIVARSGIRQKRCY
jgi:hypothetical protein